MTIQISRINESLYVSHDKCSILAKDGDWSLYENGTKKNTFSGCSIVEVAEYCDMTIDEIDPAVRFTINISGVVRDSNGKMVALYDRETKCVNFVNGSCIYGIESEEQAFDRINEVFSGLN